METRYAVYLHLDLLEKLPKNRTQSEQILRFVRSLADDPFTPGDFVPTATVPFGGAR